MIKVNNLTFGFSDRPLYQEASFGVGRGQKVGLVGPNGSGKSTLLSILRGEETAFLGQVQVQGHVSMVPQEIKLDPVMELAANIRAYADPGHKFPDFLLKKMFSDLELEIELDQNPKLLSGGQKTKLALARALLEGPDILLLDEPTNFLDTGGKAWVMQFLADYTGTVIVISHDLDLMDNRIDKILEIDVSSRTINEYKGTYSHYLTMKRERETTLKKRISAQKKHIQRMEESLHKMTRFTSKKGVRHRVQQQKRIAKEKVNLPPPPPEISRIKISLPIPKHVGEIPLKAIDISKRYGDRQILNNLDLTVIRNEKIAFVGPNGSGKSTFIKILMGLVTPENGRVLSDSRLDAGYYSQEFETWDYNQTIIDTFCKKTDKDDLFARSFLGRFLFSNEKVFQNISSLSGGEKTRLAIAMLTASSKNLLVLDEPTTYLDVLSQRIILEALKLYQGTMILVSHVPEFVREIKPTKALLFPEQKLMYWEDELLERVWDT